MALLAALPASSAIIKPVPAKAPVEIFGGVKRLKAPQSRADGLTADFSIAGGDARVPVCTHNFDSADHGWTLQADNDVQWTVKKVNAGHETRDFALIDPADVASLYVEGPYQQYKRAISSATSPAMAVPVNASLDFYVGFSQNYDDVCRLQLDILAGDDVIPVWNSGDETGEKPWRWHPVSISLADLAGRDIKLRFTYGPGSGDMFNTGGYMGDFTIDGIVVSGLQTVEHVEASTGELIALTDLSQGDVVAWNWSMPGAVPAESTERNPEIYYTADGTYDVSLTVTDSRGQTATRTRAGFVSVTGTAPVARIVPPATFRNSDNRKPLIAPLAPVTFTDGSDGFPDSRSWVFTGVSPEPGGIYETTDENPEVAYSFLHEQTVGLEVSNSHGTSADVCEVSVEYSAIVNNLRPDDRSTVFDMEDWGVFPGTNTRKITAYAERFSAPSRPVRIDGAYVFFTRAEAKHIADQIASVGCHLYTSENGLPGKRLDSMWWSVYELDLPSGSQMVGTAYPFTEAPFVDDEFFIVVDGLPEYNDSCCVSFAMADFRAEGNTALMLKDGNWIEVPEYFGAGCHTSFMIYPSVSHSVMSLMPQGAPAEFEVGKSAGTLDVELFSYLGYETPVATDSDWIRLTSTPNGMTLDTLTFAYDALPAGMTERTAVVTLTDGGSTLKFTVTQNELSGIAELDGGDGGSGREVYDIMGRRLIAPARGINIIDGRKQLR
ncbi:MAG: PKD domain-containing protein [Muribaculaceae bacterium]|nr:PKD domain-containing protein [Muribaculaceae bacterium]